MNVPQAKFIKLQAANASNLADDLHKVVAINGSNKVIPYAGSNYIGILKSLPEANDDWVYVQTEGPCECYVDPDGGTLIGQAAVGVLPDSTTSLVPVDGAGEGGFLVGHLMPEYTFAGALKTHAAEGLVSVRLINPVPLHLIP